QLNVFGAATILGDGAIALILSGDGIARHSGILHRPATQLLSAAQMAEAPTNLQSIMLFRYGPTELLAMPILAIQRVVMIEPKEIERVGDREMVNVDGAAINVLRLDRILNLSPCPDSGLLFMIIPRGIDRTVGLLASEIVDTPTIPIELDALAYRADGMLGTAMIRGQIAVFIDTSRIIEIWRNMQGAPVRSLPDATRRKILVVEDTQFFQKLIKSHLESDGFTVTLADNGEDGLIKLASGQFDLIISDIEMPVMDGFAFARRVREQTEFASIPILALTTLNSDESRKKASDSGFDAYQIKLDRQTLLTEVGRLLASGRSTPLTQARAAR
ncbi:MAG TPA: chemotaxis protein CheV, partial [Tepidisphaeraceae bacterium]|nr:chemotaxis protein CheV [Tepidisphaeraceae bacterium]